MVRWIREAAVAAVVGLGFALVVGPSAQAEVINAPSGAINVEPLAKVDTPFGMEFLPDGRLLITEKPGKLRIFADGKLSEPVEGVPTVSYRGQGGMQDVAVDPDFANNKRIYLSFTEAADPQPADAKDEGDARLTGKFDDNVLKGGAVASAKLDGNKLTDVKVIWRQVPKTIGRGHYAVHMAFSPDGKLFITSGERQRFEPAQDPNSNLGKVVRINPDGSIPTDNPFANKPGHLPDLYTIGNRNPLGIAFQPGTNKLFVNEMGPKGGDELNLIESGKNYGWPTAGTKAKHYNDAPIPEHSVNAEFTAPVYAWTPVISPSGMAFCTGEKFAKWKGSALIGGLSSKALIRVAFEGDTAKEAERVEMKRRIRDVIQSPDGSVLLLSDGKDGELLRLTPATANASAR